MRQLIYDLINFPEAHARWRRHPRSNIPSEAGTEAEEWLARTLALSDGVKLCHLVIVATFRSPRPHQGASGYDDLYCVRLGMIYPRY